MSDSAKRVYGGKGSGRRSQGLPPPKASHALWHKFPSMLARRITKSPPTRRSTCGVATELAYCNPRSARSVRRGREK